MQVATDTLGNHLWLKPQIKTLTELRTKPVARVAMRRQQPVPDKNIRSGVVNFIRGIAIRSDDGLNCPLTHNEDADEIRFPLEGVELAL